MQVSSNQSIKKRLILLLTIPILFITVVSSILINIILEDYNSLKETSLNIRKAEAISKTIYFLQYKRGISVEKSIQELDIEHKNRLRYIDEELLKSIYESKNIYRYDRVQGEKIRYILDNLEKEISLLKSDGKTTLIKDFFTKEILKLSDFIKTIPASIDDRENRNYVQAFTYLLANRETLGLIRATFYEAILKQDLSIANSINLNEYLNIYYSRKNKFLNTIDSSKENLVFFQNTYEISNINKILEKVENTLEDNSLLKTYGAKEWFNDSSSAIDILKDLESGVFNFIYKSMEKKQQILNNKIAFFVLFLILAFLSFYLSVNFIAKKILDLSDYFYKRKNEFEKIAKTDLLTGLGNRYMLNLDLENSTNPAVAIFNINNFTQTNNFYGYAFGDEIIKYICNKIDLLLKSTTLLKLYRFQGDEFVIFSNSCNNLEFTRQITVVINKMKEKISINGEEVFLSWNCGISFENNKELITTAHMALEHARVHNHDFFIYSSDISLNKMYENNIKWAKKISNAIKNDKFEVFFQKIVDNKTQTCNKYEALVRLIDENGNVISPFYFLDIAKQTRQYFPITQIVIDKTFSTFKNSDHSCSINLSMKDISNPTMVEYIFKKLEEYNIASKVVFEIVESEYIESFDDIIRFISSVKKFGSKIAIDDFGTGYSNFEYLIKLNVDYIKIDGSLIKNIVKDKNAYLTVLAIVNFAKNLNIKTIAEFVEDEEIFKIVKELDIDYSQGYYFSKPSREL